MDKFFLRHPHLDLSSHVVHGTERLFGGGSYADVYKAAMRMPPSPLKTASTVVSAALSAANANVRDVVDLSDGRLSTTGSSMVAMKRFRVHLTGMGNVEKVRCTRNRLMSEAKSISVSMIHFLIFEILSSADDYSRIQHLG